ncbi:hypothetical protein KP806_19890 [Paenibacillus sp. N4]|uniref:hypothetical protein n=1 Tax=Paenibacillus vietnamensis TaxID=2590547 RepID=UPI001CD0B39C|nr:hypothetical protein [Paenibacillus vietnamensis]MCA0757323.1 hypothetical protein [Paenibacillus vietnamensis]
MNTIYNKIIIGLAAVFIIFSAYVIFSFLTDDSEKKFMESLSLHQKINEQQIDSTKMSKVILINSTYKHIDIDLGKEQAERIINIYNSISPESIKSINTADPSIISGIVIRLKDKSEVRIQYDRKNIYVTRSEIKYIIEDSELKSIFEYELETNDI